MVLGIDAGSGDLAWLTSMSTADFTSVGGGPGGYNPDHEFLGYHQSI
jgi:hypothetical protein